MRATVKFSALSVGLIIISLILTHCGTSTQITGTWKNPEDAVTNYDAILVTVLTPNIVARRAVESSLVSELESNGVRALSSIDVFPPNFMNDKPSKEDVLNKVREEKMKGVLTVTLLDEQEETRYVPGSTAYAPYPRYGYYGSFGGYYGNYYSMVYDPGYYKTSRTYFIENNLYNVETEQLAWSAQSKTYDPSNIESASRALARALIYKMKQDGVIN